MIVTTEVRRGLLGERGRSLASGQLTENSWTFSASWETRESLLGRSGSPSTVSTTPRSRSTEHSEDCGEREEGEGRKREEGERRGRGEEEYVVSTAKVKRRNAVQILSCLYFSPSRS